MNSMKPSSVLGKVYLVGAGPGAADLITVRGARILEKADIVFYDALVDQEMFEFCPNAIKVSVGKRCGKLSSAQLFINKRLTDAAQRHQIVVRLKGGDPMMFGRADEEIQALKKSHIEVEVVPGITAALAGAAAIQQSLTLRGISRSVAFITLAKASDSDNDAIEQENKPDQHPTADTLVYYMGRKDASAIAKQLIEGDSQKTSATPVHILEAVSTKNQRHWSSTLGEMANGKANDWFNSASPALIMVGEALKNTGQLDAYLQCPSTEINDGLQDSIVLTDRRRRA